jgi:hypothetical protein
MIEGFKTWTRQVYRDGYALVNRIGTDDSPTYAERKAFREQEKQWRAAIEYYAKKFRADDREEAANTLGRWLDRFGPKLTEMRVRLGVD